MLKLQKKDLKKAITALQLFYDKHSEFINLSNLKIEFDEKFILSIANMYDILFVEIPVFGESEPFVWFTPFEEFVNIFSGRDKDVEFEYSNGLFVNYAGKKLALQDATHHGFSFGQQYPRYIDKFVLPVKYLIDTSFVESDCNLAYSDDKINVICKTEVQIVSQSSSNLPFEIKGYLTISDRLRKKVVKIFDEDSILNVDIYLTFISISGYYNNLAYKILCGSQYEPAEKGDYTTSIDDVKLFSKFEIVGSSLSNVQEYFGKDKILKMYFSQYGNDTAKFTLEDFNDGEKKLYFIADMVYSHPEFTDKDTIFVSSNDFSPISPEKDYILAVDKTQVLLSDKSENWIYIFSQYKQNW